MLGILVVCTGNVCRSPLGEYLLRDAVAGTRTVVASRGIRALRGQPATPETVALAASMGLDPATIGQHRAQQISEADLYDADLVLAMARDHRREVVELSPSRVRSTFLLRELAALAAPLSDAELQQTADAAGPAPADRLAALLQRVAGMRGTIDPLAPADAEVVDPYRRPAEVYEESGRQIAPGVAQAARLIRLAATTPAGVSGP